MPYKYKRKNKWIIKKGRVFGVKKNYFRRRRRPGVKNPPNPIPYWRRKKRKPDGPGSGPLIPYLERKNKNNKWPSGMTPDKNIQPKRKRGRPKGSKNKPKGYAKYNTGFRRNTQPKYKQPTLPWYQKLGIGAVAGNLLWGAISMGKFL